MANEHVQTVGVKQYKTNFTPEFGMMERRIQDPPMTHLSLIQNFFHLFIEMQLVIKKGTC